MKPEDDPWLRDAHANAEHLDREIRKLTSLIGPIRSDLPIVTKYQDFWTLDKIDSRLIPGAEATGQNDRDLLWKEFNALCREVKEHQKPEYGTLEPSRGACRRDPRTDEICRRRAVSQLPMYLHSWNVVRR